MGMKQSQQHEFMTYNAAFLVLLWLRILHDMDPEEMGTWLAWAAA